MNHGELIDITAAPDSPCFAWPRFTEQEPLLWRYLRAKKVAQYLGLKWLYIHGNEFDITLILSTISLTSTMSSYSTFRSSLPLLVYVAIFASL